MTKKFKIDVVEASSLSIQVQMLKRSKLKKVASCNLNVIWEKQNLKLSKFNIYIDTKL